MFQYKNTLKENAINLICLNNATYVIITKGNRDTTSNSTKSKLDSKTNNKAVEKI